MRVILHTEAFNARPDRLVHLTELFPLAIRRCHDVLVEPGATEPWEDWLRTNAAFAATYRRTAQDSQSRQAQAWSSMEVRVGDPDVSDWESSSPMLHLLDAVELLSLPLQILVEDETSDGEFLDATVPPPLRPAWQDARSKQRLSIVTLGGVTQVSRRMVGPRVEPPLSRRSFVLIDSDAPCPWVSPGRSREACWEALPSEAKKAAMTARRVHIPVEILDRRMAENYLPAAALETWVAKLKPSEQREKRRHVGAFEALTEERKHHHHLKKGIRPGERELYGNISEEAERALSFSLGDSTWHAFRHMKDSDAHSYGVHAELAPLFQQLLRLL